MSDVAEWSRDRRRFVAGSMGLAATGLLPARMTQAQTASRASSRQAPNAWIEVDTAVIDDNIGLQKEVEDLTGTILADQYTVWGQANPKIPKH